MLDKCLCDEAVYTSNRYFHNRRVTIYRWKTPMYEDHKHLKRLSEFIRVTVVEGEQDTLDRAEAMYDEFGEPYHYRFSHR